MTKHNLANQVRIALPVRNNWMLRPLRTVVVAVLIALTILLGTPSAGQTEFPSTFEAAEARQDRRLTITDLPPDLGRSTPLVTNAYAGSGHANVVPWRWDALASVEIDGEDYQAITYWSKESTPYGVGLVVVGHRKVGEPWTYYLYDGTRGLPHLNFHIDDRHYAVNLGLDEKGYLHLSYGAAYNPLGYRRSTTPLNRWNGQLTDPLPMLGTNENVVVYPSFTNDRDRRLYFVFRDGVSGQANTHLYMYDADNQRWQSPPGLRQGLIFEGRSTMPQASIYHGPPVFDDAFGNGGHMHFVFNLRNTNNQPYDIGYVRFDGTNWTRVDGTPQTMPVTVHNYYRVEQIGPTEALVDFRHYDVDGNGNLHFTYVKRDAQGIRQAYYGYYTGASWVVHQMTNQGAPGVTSGLAMQGIAIDRDTNIVYLFHMYVAMGRDITLWRSGMGDYTTWTRRNIYGTNPGYFEVTYDRWQWQAHKRLHFPVTHYYGADPNGHAIVLLEWANTSVPALPVDPPDPVDPPGPVDPPARDYPYRILIPFVHAVPSVGASSPSQSQSSATTDGGTSDDNQVVLPALGQESGAGGSLIAAPQSPTGERLPEPASFHWRDSVWLAPQWVLPMGVAIIVLGLLVWIGLSRGLRGR
jgi:hypothetical protein